MAKIEMDGPKPFPLPDLDGEDPREQYNWVLEELLDSYDPEGALQARREVLIAIRDTIVAMFSSARRVNRSGKRSFPEVVDLGLTEETQAEMAKLKPRSKSGRPDPDPDRESE